MALVSPPGPRPEHRISTSTWVILQSLAGLFDILKFGAATIVFTAPFMAGAIAGVVAANHASTAACWAGATAVAPIALVAGTGVMQAACDAASSWGATHAQTVGAIAAGAGGLVTAVLEVVSGPVTATVEAVGVAFAIIIGLVGWIILGGLLLLKLTPLQAGDSGAQIMVSMLVGFCFSELPLVDALPTFTPAIWRVVHLARKADAKRIKEWDAKNAAWLASQAQARADYVRSVQARIAQEQADYEAANDNEIPDALPAAA